MKGIFPFLKKLSVWFASKIFKKFPIMSKIAIDTLEGDELKSVFFVYLKISIIIIDESFSRDTNWQSDTPENYVPFIAVFE